jgi:hypothetical protein
MALDQASENSVLANPASEKAAPDGTGKDNSQDLRNVTDEPRCDPA